MKDINDFILEKLQISSKVNKKQYKYFPKTKEELEYIIGKIIKDSPDGNIDLNNIDISNPNINSLENLFAFNTKIHTLDVSEWDVSNIRNLEYTFYELDNLEYVDVTGWDIKNVTSMVGIFSSNEKLKTIDGIEDWNVSNVTDFAYAFELCGNLKLDLSKWKIKNGVDIYHIYYRSPGVSPIAEIMYK